MPGVEIHGSSDEARKSAKIKEIIDSLNQGDVVASEDRWMRFDLIFVHHVDDRYIYGFLPGFDEGRASSRYPRENISKIEIVGRTNSLAEKAVTRLVRRKY